MPEITRQDLEGRGEPTAGAEARPTGTLQSDPDETIGLTAKTLADAITTDLDDLASRYPSAPARAPRP